MSQFILAMVLHPEVMHRAQQEIDAVVGSGRLPDFADRPHLPYGMSSKTFSSRAYVVIDT
jgi:hypothetical protein